VEDIVTLTWNTGICVTVFWKEISHCIFSVLTDLPAKRHITHQSPETYNIGSGIENFIVQQVETSIFTQVSR
jgi:hypothetical protein